MTRRELLAKLALSTGGVAALLLGGCRNKITGEAVNSGEGAEESAGGAEDPGRAGEMKTTKESGAEGAADVH